MTDRMRTLREWYRYLDQQARLVERLYSGRVPSGRVQPPVAAPRRAEAPPRSPGRPRLDRSRQQVLRRLLDPEVSLHEAALLLSVSKSTLRRYTDSGRLPSFRSPGGQRRFHLSELLAFVEDTRTAPRAKGRPPVAGRGRAARRTAARRA